MHPGCGIQLAWKFVKEAGIHPTYTSASTARHFIEGVGVIQLPDPVAAGGVVFVDNESIAKNISSLINMKDVLCICANSSGSPKFVKQVGIKGYAATASVAFPDDLLNKLKKVVALQGARLVEINTPCSHEWKADSSNMVEIARQATEIGLWPLFEISKGKFTLNYRPLKLSPMEMFISLQKKIVPDKALVEKSWHSYLMARPFEAEL